MTGTTVAGLSAENRKLRKINDALMSRVEHSMDVSGNSYALFQTAIALEKEVGTRTRDLQETLRDLEETNARLQQAKEEAERARVNLAAAIDAVQEGFALFGADDRLVLCNRWFRDLMPDIADRVHPGLAFADYARLVAHSTHRAPVKNQTAEDWLHMRLTVHGRKHATFLKPLVGDRWIQVNERRTPDGGAAIMHTDVTDMVRWERHESDKRLDEQARLVRATLDHMNQGVCVFDHAQTLVAWNEQYRVLLGLPFSLLKRGVSFARIVDYIVQNTLIVSQRSALQVSKWVMSRERRTPLETELRRSDGVILQVSGRAMPDGGFVVSFTDVTAEREATEALHRANETLEQRVAERTAELTAVNSKLRQEITERRAIEEELVRAKDAAETANLSKTRFLAAASHDLLQPLNAAKLFIASLAESPVNRSQAEMVQRIRSAFGSVESLLNALLDISKLDAGAVEIEPTEFPIAAILQPIENEFRALAHAKDIELRVVPSSAVVVSDPSYLRRVVQNLTANAIRYTRQGRVLVGCRPRGASLRIEVWDTGIGLKPEDMKRIFEEFSRVENQDAPGTRGMGLGLAIVERACRLLDHPIDTRSELGRGSMFAITVPLGARRDTHDVLHDGAGPPQLEYADNIITLVIENDADVRQGMTALLGRWNMEILTAGSSGEALSAISDLGMAPDVILADYHLDGDDTGLKAIARLREETGDDIPAILITADRGEGVARAASALNAPVMIKPIKPAKLRALLYWAVSRQGAAE